MAATILMMFQQIIKLKHMRERTIILKRDQFTRRIRLQVLIKKYFKLE